MSLKGFPGGPVVKNLPDNVGDAGLIQSLGQENPLEKEMATHSSILAGKSHGQSSLAGHSPGGCKRVRHDWATKQQRLQIFVYITLTAGLLKPIRLGCISRISYSLILKVRLDNLLF